MSARYFCSAGVLCLAAAFIISSLFPSEPQSSFSEDDDGLGNSCTIGSEIYLDVSYLHYLYDARLSISSCIQACQVWSAPYDGENPPPEKYQPGVLEEPLPDGRQVQTSLNRVPQLLLTHPRPNPLPGKELPSIGQLELEWDDSFDACPVQGAEAPQVPKASLLPSSEPPKHIQEMRRSAIILVNGSFIEENDFQDDVLVYDLVAKKDASEAEQTAGEASGSSSEEVSLRTGSSTTPPTSVMEDNGKSSLKAKVKGQTKCNGNIQSETNTSEVLLAQYEELIHTLVSQSGGKQLRADGEQRQPVTGTEEEEEEEEMDFTSFTAEAPEPEKPQSPFGSIPRLRSGSSRGTYALPFTGPFISVLLSRLENMLSNTLHVNLLLTGIVAQLAAYPQPLLRSFLLNTNLVFQPTVRSLYQVLATVKNQIDQLAACRKDFSELITVAQHWLLAREASHLTTDQTSSSGSNQHEGGTMLRNSPPPKPKAISPEQTEVFATVLFSEFLKELAAIAQEHSVLSYAPVEEQPPLG